MPFYNMVIQLIDLLHLSFGLYFFFACVAFITHPLPPRPPPYPYLTPSKPYPIPPTFYPQLTTRKQVEFLVVLVERVRTASFFLFKWETTIVISVISAPNHLCQKIFCGLIFAVLIWCMFLPLKFGQRENVAKYILILWMHAQTEMGLVHSYWQRKIF